MNFKFNIKLFNLYFNPLKYILLHPLWKLTMVVTIVFGNFDYHLYNHSFFCLFFVKPWCFSKLVNTSKWVYYFKAWQKIIKTI